VLGWWIVVILRGLTPNERFLFGHDLQSRVLFLYKFLGFGREMPLISGLSKSKRVGLN